ncbi:MAG TPA: hypothetical protein VMV04_19360 [Thermodesulfobacteriota bacterium]|nr:hypothetical protein [Thermodesulfobacteriota bacterium]
MLFHVSTDITKLASHGSGPLLSAPLSLNAGPVRRFRLKVDGYAIGLVFRIARLSRYGQPCR